MQIRELSLKELENVYGVLSQLHLELSYDEFEDLVYDMRHTDYKMIGILEKDKIVTYAGVSIGTNFYHKRHLFVSDFVTDKKYRAKGYGEMMLDYLKDYAKMAMCENLVFSSELTKDDVVGFFQKNGFVKKSFTFVRSLER